MMITDKKYRALAIQDALTQQWIGKHRFTLVDKNDNDKVLAASQSEETIHAVWRLFIIY